MSGSDLFEIYFALETAAAYENKTIQLQAHARQLKSAAPGPVWIRTKGDYFKQ